MKPSVRPSVRSSTSASTRRSCDASRGRDAGRLQARVLGRDVRVEPGARGGDGVHGHVRPARHVVQQPVGLDPLLDRREKVRVRRPEVRGRARRAVVPVSGRRRTRLEPLASLRSADREATSRRRLRHGGGASRRRCRRMVSCATPVTASGYATPTRSVNTTSASSCGNELAPHHENPSPVRARSTSLMPTNGETIPPAP